MNLVAVAAGVFLLRSVEHRLVYSAGEELRIAAAEVADKLDRLLFERYGDAHMMAQALALRPSDTAYLTSYVGWMKTNHAPVYAWLGVTDSRGMMITATESSLRGQDFSRTGWFQRVSQTKTIQVDDVALHEGEGETESVAFSAPMLDAEGNLSGIITSRVPVSILEEVTTGTLRSLEARPEFAGAVVFQMVTDQGRVFVDSDLRRNRSFSQRDSGALSSRAVPLGDLGFVEEQSHGHAIVMGFARTKGFGQFPGLGWHVLVRMDRDRILEPILSILWKVSLMGAVVWVPMVVLLFWSTSHLRAEYRQVQQESSWARAAEAALLQSHWANASRNSSSRNATVSITIAASGNTWPAEKHTSSTDGLKYRPCAVPDRNFPLNSRFHRFGSETRYFSAPSFGTSPSAGRRTRN
jgi:hypothetical protein